MIICLLHVFLDVEVRDRCGEESASGKTEELNNDGNSGNKV